MKKIKMIEISVYIVNKLTCEFAKTILEVPAYLKKKHIAVIHKQLVSMYPDAFVNFDWVSEEGGLLFGMPINMLRDEKTLPQTKYFEKWHGAVPAYIKIDLDIDPDFFTYINLN